MLNQFNTIIKKDFSFLFGKRLLVALSGGVDSIVLSVLLKQMNFDLTLAHCNFQLRAEESLGDEKFVEKFAQKNKIPLYVKRFETEKKAKEKGLTIQVVARELRYQWFYKLSDDYGFDYILTAHHCDDSIETFFINLLRGTGIAGLSGIPCKNGKIIRPLLAFSREQIEKYAIENRIQWREDSSNQSDKYIRNKIRHHIIPSLKELKSDFQQNFNKTQYILTKTMEFIEYQIIGYKEKYWREKNGIIYFNIKEICENPHQNFIIYHLMKPYGFDNLLDLKRMLTANTGKQLLSNTHRIIKDRDNWLIVVNDINQEKDYLIDNYSFIEIVEPIHLKFSQQKEMEQESLNKIFLDLNKIKFPIVLRKRKEGDVFFPSGMQGRKKKLSKFFKDEKYSLVQKENQWILTDSKNQILWVVGKRTDHRYKPTEHTISFLKIEFLHN